MREIKSPEIKEISKPESENYKEIKPKNGMTAEMAKTVWDNIFKEFKKEPGYYNLYDERLKCVPKMETSLGHWEGKRGVSKLIPNGEEQRGIDAINKLAEKGLDGIEYKNAQPDFSKCSEATVRIENMTENRENYMGKDGGMRYGNFTQADIKCSEKWNTEAKDGKTDWTAREIYNWRHENRCSWHEKCDRKTMELVPYEIHSYFIHSGGVSECRTRDQADAEGGFDE